MPRTTRTFDRDAGAYRLNCLTEGCGAECLTGSARDANRYSIDRLTGAYVHSTFRFLGEGRGNSARCRDCERARRAQRTSGPRVPGTTGRVTPAGDRRFGVELELMFPTSVNQTTIRDALRSAGLRGWTVVRDGSLVGHGNGWEVVSPILQGEDGHRQIRVACAALSALGASGANTACGLHVHHEIRELRIEAVRALVEAWAAHQPMIDGLVAPSRRGGRAYYCRHLGSTDLARVRNSRTLRDLQSATNRMGYSEKYRTLNLRSYGRYGTAEVRQHQGTVNAEKISSWVRFGQALIVAAATGELTATPTTRMRDLLGAMGSHLEETARTFLLGRTVEFGAVAA